MVEQVAIPKGTVVVCPLCLSKVGKVTRDIKYKDLIDEGDIDGFKKGDKLLCLKCGFPLAFDIHIGYGKGLYFGAVIYTDKGWMPDIFRDREETQNFIYKVLREDLVDYLKREGIWKDEWLKICRNDRIMKIIEKFK